jgi:hypothetical protein
MVTFPITVASLQGLTIRELVEIYNLYPVRGVKTFRSRAVALARVAKEVAYFAVPPHKRFDWCPPVRPHSVWFQRCNEMVRVNGRRVRALSKAVYWFSGRSVVMGYVVRGRGGRLRRVYVQ